MGYANPTIHLDLAQTARARADRAQTEFRALRAAPVPLSSPPAASVAASAVVPAVARRPRGLLKKAVQIVVERNRELGHLGAFVATSDVTARRDGSHFWSGDARNARQQVTASAMETAQHLARQARGATVEMTRGGAAMERYAGEDSFGYLRERFTYLDNQRAPHTQRARLIERGAARAGVGMSEVFGPVMKGPAAPNPLAVRGSAAGALWDVLSARFAGQAQGHVRAIHAASRDDAYFQGPHRTSTWHTVEEPILRHRAQSTVTRSFAEDLGPDLRPPRPASGAGWRETFGSRGIPQPRSRL